MSETNVVASLDATTQIKKAVNATGYTRSIKVLDFLNATNRHTLPSTTYYSALASITGKLTRSPDIETNDMEERIESHGIAVRHNDRKILSLSSYKSQTKLKQWSWY